MSLVEFESPTELVPRMALKWRCIHITPRHPNSAYLPCLQ